MYERKVVKLTTFLPDSVVNSLVELFVLNLFSRGLLLRVSYQLFDRLYFGFRVGALLRSRRRRGRESVSGKVLFGSEKTAKHGLAVGVDVLLVGLLLHREPGFFELLLDCCTNRQSVRIEDFQSCILYCLTACLSEVYPLRSDQTRLQFRVVRKRVPDVKFSLHNEFSLVKESLLQYRSKDTQQHQSLL
nr:MAG TPA: hypothetical protein [Caudoviricetes sp.]